MNKRLKKIIGTAERWRLENPGRPAGGWILIYRGRAFGWMRTLDDPQNWCVGCFVVAAGDVFKSVGAGDTASAWEAVK